MRSSSFSILHIFRPERSLPHTESDRSDARCHTAHERSRSRAEPRAIHSLPGADAERVA
jgi:hypothetical protein